MSEAPEAVGAPQATFAQKVGRGLVWNQVSRVVELGAAYVASILVARALGPVSFGTYSVALSLVTLTYFATSLGLNEVLNVQVPRLGGSPGRIAHLLRALLRLRVTIALVLATSLFVFAGTIARVWRDPALEAVLHVGAIYAFFYNVSLLLEYFLVGSLQLPRVSRVRIGVQLVNLAAAAAALRFGWQAPVLFLVMACSAAVGVTWLAWGARAALGARPEPFDLGPMRRFGLTLWVTNFVNFFLGRQADILIIGYYRPGTEAAGCYSAASLLAMLCASALLMGAEGVSLAAFSELERRVDRAGLGRLWSLHLKMDVLLSVPLVVFGARFASDIVRALYGARFAAAGPMMLAYAFAWVVARATGGGTNMTVLYAMEDPRVPLAIYGAAGAFNLVANLILVHAYGGAGAVLGTGLAMIGSSIASGLIVMRRTGAFFPLGFALRVVLASAAGAFAAHLMPRPGGVIGVALAGVVSLVICVALLRLMRPLGDDDRRLLVRLNPRLQALVSRL
ncbi:MAG TPA: oligosaccharide flippase family protein [Candidatus Saccharimonadaceae bacterium]|nr:oligosaccharide flippase family protein [Candidatus Saccharimonadaceae bacterium]